MSSEKVYDKERIRILACQKDFPNPTAEALERILKRSPPADFLVSSEYSFMFEVRGKAEDDSEVQKFIELAQKYDINLILCGIDQVIEGKTFCSCLFISRSGKVYSHSKKDNARLQHQGTDSGVFPSEYGNIGILICVEIEDHIVANECLSEKPVIIFNPAYINCTGENPIFKRSSEMISKKLCIHSRKNRLVIVRVDTAYPNGMASSSVICPDHTYFFPKHLSSVMYYEFSLDFRDNFQSFLTAPLSERSYEIDNVGNRYLSHNFDKIRLPIRDFALYDDMMNLVTLHKKRVDLWNFNTIKSTKFFQRMGRFAISPTSKLLCSKKDGVIGCFSPNEITMWDSRSGKILMDLDSMKLASSSSSYDTRCLSLTNIMVDGKFVSLTSDGELCFFEKSDLKFSSAVKFPNLVQQEGGEEGEKVLVSFEPTHNFTIYDSCKNSIERYDYRYPDKPVLLYKHKKDVKIVSKNIRMDKQNIYFTDSEGSLFSLRKVPGEEEEEQSCRKLIDKYTDGISDFLCFSNSSYGFVVDEKKSKKLSVVSFRENGKLEYQFGGIGEETELKGIESILFDGKTKIFLRSQNFVRVIQFQQNRKNIFLGNLLK